MNINNNFYGFSTYTKDSLPPQQYQLKLINIALQVQRDTTIGLFEKSTQLLDVYA